MVRVRGRCKDSEDMNLSHLVFNKNVKVHRCHSSTDKEPYLMYFDFFFADASFDGVIDLSRSCPLVVSRL